MKTQSVAPPTRLPTPPTYADANTSAISQGESFVAPQPVPSAGHKRKKALGQKTSLIGGAQ